MKFDEKKQLVFLLDCYKNELLKRKKTNSWGREVYEDGVKAQYNHARIISNTLSNEIGNEISPY